VRKLKGTSVLSENTALQLSQLSPVMDRYGSIPSRIYKLLSTTCIDYPIFSLSAQYFHVNCLND
jgi:hypothetical protein